MLRDVEHLVSKLGKVEGFGDLGTYLMKIIEDKEIKAVLSADLLLVPAKEEGKSATKEGEGKSGDENTGPRGLEWVIK